MLSLASGPGLARIVAWLDALFGEGDSDHPVWLLGVRLDILLLLAAGAALLVIGLPRLRARKGLRVEVAVVILITGFAALLRFVAGANVLDNGGIEYSRMLLGYKGHFAAAQVYALLYRVTARDIEHAIAVNRILGTLTVPLAYLLGRSLVPGARAYGIVAALLVAACPAHVLFSASGALAGFAGFLMLLSYVLLVRGVALAEHDARGAHLYLLVAALGLALLTQVRWESALLLVPPLVYVAIRARSVGRRQLAPAAAVLGVGLVFFGACALRAGVSPRGATAYLPGLTAGLHDVLVNPFFAAPLLVAGALVPAAKRSWLGVAAIVAWGAALGVAALASPTGHHVARVFSCWLPLLLLFSAYGLYLLVAAPHRMARAAGFAVTGVLVALPLAFPGALRTRYVETAENDAYRALLAEMPRGARWLIVPDDELRRRRYGVTEELDQKYRLIPMPPGRRVRLAGITEALEHPARLGCAAGGCLFFAGLPCLAPRHQLVGAQCAALLASRRVAVVGERDVVAAPFEPCSVRVAGRRRAECAPAVRRWRFVLYGLDGG